VFAAYAFNLTDQLIAGIPQQVNICIKEVHSSVTWLHVTSTPGLTVVGEENIELEAGDDNEDKHIIVTVIADYTNFNVEPSSHDVSHLIVNNNDNKT